MLIDSMDLVGDVKDCDCIIVDDMIDSTGTFDHSRAKGGIGRYT
jgi:phosphoribosylpyrophosphate synthetase